MAGRATASCDVGIQTVPPVQTSRSPILDHRLYNFEDSDSDWNFLKMELASSEARKGVNLKSMGKRKGTSPTLPSPQEDGYCSQEEGNDWNEDQSYQSPLKDAPRYQTYLALVPDLDEDLGPESPIRPSEVSSGDSRIRKVSDDQTGSQGDATPLFEQSPASTPSELASPISENLSIDDAERERLKTDLAEVELDIEALRQTLRAKEIKAREIRRKLGITPVVVFKNDVKTGWTNFKQSSAYNKTKSGLQTAGQKTGAAFTTFGSAVTKKLGEVRESNAFKSFEEKVSNTATSIKTKVSGQKEEESSFEDALQSSANQRTPDPQPESQQPLPEEKVPM